MQHYTDITDVGAAVFGIMGVCLVLGIDYLWSYWHRRRNPVSPKRPLTLYRVVEYVGAETDYETRVALLRHDTGDLELDEHGAIRLFGSQAAVLEWVHSEQQAALFPPRR